jgi:dihydrofolate reductase
MGRLIISENLSLDGVVQDPTGEEGLNFGGWFNLVTEADRAEWAKMALEEALRTEALLLGRRSYEFFAARWPSRTGPFADRLNSLAKYVVSTTLQDPTWRKTTVLRGDAATEVSKLKEQVKGDLVVYASAQLVHRLMQHDLVDELRLMIYPFVLGDGERLFGETTDVKRMRLVHHQTVGDSLTYLIYETLAVR